MKSELAGDVQRILARDPDLSFRESALLKQLNQAPRALGSAIDQLERAGVVISCRILCPGKPDDREVRISVLGAKAMPTLHLLQDAKQQVMLAEHRRRSSQARAGGTAGTRAFAQRRLIERLTSQYGTRFRPETGELRCARCSNWRDAKACFSGAQLQARDPKCISCHQPPPQRRKFLGRGYHRSAGV